MHDHPMKNAGEFYETGPFRLAENLKLKSSFSNVSKFSVEVKE